MGAMGCPGEGSTAAVVWESAAGRGGAQGLPLSQCACSYALNNREDQCILYLWFVFSQQNDSQNLSSWMRVARLAYRELTHIESLRSRLAGPAQSGKGLWRTGIKGGVVREQVDRGTAGTFWLEDAIFP